MNSAKKIMKNQGLGTKSFSGGDDIISRKNKILILIGIVMIVACTAVICYIQLRPRQVLTVKGTDSSGSSVTNTVNMTETMYDIYATETQYNAYESIYTQMYGTTFWEAEGMDKMGRTGAQVAKKGVMQTLKQREILYMEALKNNLSLTDEEKKTVEENVKSARENMTDGQKKLAGLDEGTIQEVMEKQALADKYKENVIAGLGIDEEALKATVSKKDYRQYTLQYYTFEKTETKDDKTVDKDDATLKKAKEDMEALQKKAAKAKDFTKDIITDSDGDSKDDKTGISYSTHKLVETDEDFLDKAVRKQVKAMKNNEVSKVMETKDAYYVIKMVNNNDSEAYDTQCETVISDKKESAFKAKYKADIKPNYETEVQSYWKGRVSLGYMTSVE